MSCDVGEMTEKLENELCSSVYRSAHSPTFPSLHLRHNSFFNPSVALPTSELILQPFRRFTYVTAHSPNPSVGSLTSQLILQPFFCFSYVTGSSLTSAGEPPMINRPCAAHRAVYITNGVRSMYLLSHYRASYICGAELRVHDPISAVGL